MKSKTKIFLLVFLLAVLMRILYLEQIKGIILFQYPIVDSGAYDATSAIAAMRTNLRGLLANFFRFPLYKTLLILLYRIGGHNVYLSRFVQAIIGAFSCCLIVWIGDKAFDLKVGLLSGLVACFYWPFIAFGAKFLPVTLAIFFCLCAVVFLYKFLDNGKALWVFTSGVFFALSSLARANILLLCVVMPITGLYFFRSKPRIKERARYSILFIMGVLLMVLPPIVSKSVSKGGHSSVYTNYGIATYIGADLEHIKVISPGFKETRKAIHPGGENKLWLGKSLKFISENPVRYLKNLMLKLYLLWNQYEFSPRENINHFRKKSGFLSMPLFGFGFVAAFSILGFLLAGRRTGQTKIWPLGCFVAAYHLSIMPFAPYARYRLPLVPFLIVFAAYGIIECFGYLRKKDWGMLARGGGAGFSGFCLDQYKSPSGVS